jgi:hypothetical protein
VHALHIRPASVCWVARVDQARSECALVYVRSCGELVRCSDIIWCGHLYACVTGGQNPCLQDAGRRHCSIRFYVDVLLASFRRLSSVLGASAETQVQVLHGRHRLGATTDAPRLGRGALAAAIEKATGQQLNLRLPILYRLIF